MNSSVIHDSETRASAARYFSRLRVQDILVLQGPPLLGAAFAMTHPHARDIDSIIVLLAGNLFLMTHVFMINDWAGLAADLADPKKAAGVFTARGAGTREIGGITAALLVVSLLIFSWLGAVTVGLALAIAALSAFYSLPHFHWKARPLLNSATHLCGGVLHFLLGYCVGHALDRRGLVTGMYFALVFAAGHLTQEVRDYAGDATNAIRTNAVAFGPRRTFIASLILFASAQVLFLALAFENIVPRGLAAVVLLFPIQIYWSLQTLREGLTYENVSRLQAQYRVLYAFIGMCIVAVLLVARVHAIAL